MPFYTPDEKWRGVIHAHNELLVNGADLDLAQNMAKDLISCSIDSMKRWTAKMNRSGTL